MSLRPYGWQALMTNYRGPGASDYICIVRSGAAGERKWHRWEISSTKGRNEEAKLIFFHSFLFFYFFSLLKCEWRKYRSRWCVLFGVLYDGSGSGSRRLIGVFICMEMGYVYAVELANTSIGAFVYSFISKYMLLSCACIQICRNIS